MRRLHRPLRRLALRAVTAAPLAGAVAGVVAHTNFGPMNPPLPVPDTPLVMAGGQRTTLAAVLAGKATALQFFFTGCSATCPMQGALFEEVQRRLPRQAPVPIQLLSLSLDPLADDPNAMSKWLRTFHAGRQWTAGAPSIDALDRLSAVMQAGTRSQDRHTTQVFLVDTQGRLVFRTFELPRAEEVVAALARVR